MRPRTAKAVNRSLVLASFGALLAAGGTIAAAPTPADTVITGEGIFQPRGSTAKQFGGALCQVNACVTTGSMPTDVNAQARRFREAVAATEGPVIVHGYSLSAAAIERAKLDWQRNPETAPESLRIITTGSPYNRYGGTQRNTAAARQTAAAPIVYEQLDVVAQYGSVEDKPTRFGWYSAIEVSLARHQTGYNVDINDPGNLINEAGDYMLLPARELRQLRGTRFLRDIGWVTPERYEEIDAERRALIEADYDRPELHEQGPGADWANGVKPERLREDDDAEEALASDEDSREVLSDEPERAEAAGSADSTSDVGADSSSGGSSNPNNTGDSDE